MENKISEEKEEKKNKKVVFAILAILLLIILIILLFLFRVPQYKITFDSNGGTEVQGITVKKNEKIKQPDDPTKEGYIFAGWYYNDELFDFDTPVVQDMTLKAEWSIQGNAKVEGIELNVKTLTLKVGGTAIIKATVLPENAKDKDLKWTSSDESVAKVDQNGKITAIKEGTAIITVTTADGNYKASCKVTVKKDVVSVTGISISGPNDLKVGNTIKLRAYITPSNATNKNVIWSSSNKNVATVDRYGNVKGLRAGTVTITATTVDGGITATHKIKIKAATTSTTQTVKVSKVTISGENQIYVGESTKLVAKIEPSNATNKNVTWESSNTSIATVDKDGNVKGIKAGTVTITVTTIDGNKKAEHTITIKNKTVSVTGLTISGPQTVNVNSSIKLTAKIEPSNATNKNVTWKSSNTSIATVDKNGNVKGLKEGTVTITAITADGNKKASYTINVKSVYSITLTAMTKETGIFQYAITVTKDGKSFNNYSGVNYNGRTAPFKQYVSKNFVNTSVKSAEIILNSGRVSATVSYK